MGVGFDGLIIEVRPSQHYSFGQTEVVLVDKVVNQDILFGDRNIGFPVADNSLFINIENLELLKEARREFSSKNPFGQVATERKYKRDGLELTIVEFDAALSLTLREVKRSGDATVSRTVYSQNFIAKELIGLVEEAVDECLDEDRLDELPFVLKNIETNWRTDNNG